MKDKICPKCGKTFECAHSTDCWCMNVKLSKEAIEKIKQLYPDCLCEICLKEFESAN
jgi:hypothetical protein